MLGKLAAGRRRAGRVRAPCAAKRGGVGWSLATMASPPSSWRASRARPPLMRSAKKPTAVSAATASITATHQQAQLAGAEVARQLAPGRAARPMARAAGSASCASSGDLTASERAPAAAPNAPESLNAACKRRRTRRSRAVLQWRHGHHLPSHLRLPRLADDRARARRGRRLHAAPRARRSTPPSAGRGPSSRSRRTPRRARRCCWRRRATKRSTTSAASTRSCSRCATTRPAHPALADACARRC